MSKNKQEFINIGPYFFYSGLYYFLTNCYTLQSVYIKEHITYGDICIKLRSKKFSNEIIC